MLKRSVFKHFPMQYYLLLWLPVAILLYNCMGQFLAEKFLSGYVIIEIITNFTLHKIHWPDLLTFILKQESLALSKIISKNGGKKHNFWIRTFKLKRITTTLDNNCNISNNHNHKAQVQKYTYKSCGCKYSASLFNEYVTFCSSIGWIHWFYGVCGSSKLGSERESGTEIEVVLQALWCRWEWLYWQRWVVKHH